MPMAFKFLALALLSLTVNVVAAAPSAAEIALRNAITAPEEETTFILTTNIVLTRDLPPIPYEKILTVQSADIPGAPFTIDGAKKYLIFHNANLPLPEATLTLKNLILTRSKFAAVDIIGPGDQGSLWLENVRFVNNPRALNLKFSRGEVTKCTFSGSTKSAVVITSEVDGPNDEVIFKNCIFSNNKAEKGLGGGALRANPYGSFTVEDCTFTKNSADTYGGAVWVDNVVNNIYRSVFKGNKATLSGGAIYGINANLDMVNTTFDDNAALKKPGGAFALDGGSSFKFCSCKFSRNVGAKKVSNGYVRDYSNVITTAVGVTIPAVTVEPSATVTFMTEEPCFRY